MKLRIAKKIVKNSQKETPTLHHHKGQIAQATTLVNRVERKAAKKAGKNA